MCAEMKIILTFVRFYIIVNKLLKSQIFNL